MSRTLFTPFTDAGSGGTVRGRLLSIAQRVAAEYAENPKVAAILVAGSVSRGPVDEVSDIDTSVYLHEPFTPEEFEAEKNRAIASGGGLYGGDEKDGFALWRCVDNVKYDIGCITLPQIEEIFTEVLEKHTLDNDSHLIADGVLKSIPLYGEEIIRDMQKRLSNFPEELAPKMVEANIRATPFWVTRDMCAGRNEQVWFAELALEHIRRLLWVLCGLNRRYYPGKVKGFAHVADELTIAPKDFRRRAERLFRMELPEGAGLLEELVNETYDLVARHMPQIDLTKAREGFSREVACRECRKG